jgi:hypothetical protein
MLALLAVIVLFVGIRSGMPVIGLLVIAVIIAAYSS